LFEKKPSPSITKVNIRKSEILTNTLSRKGPIFIELFEKKQLLFDKNAFWKKLKSVCEKTEECERKKPTFYYCLFFFIRICVGLTSPGAGKGGGGGEGGGGRLPLREGGEVTDALAPLDGPVPDLQRKKSEKYYISVLYFLTLSPSSASSAVSLEG
jgi:hypothetical protein